MELLRDNDFDLDSLLDRESSSTSYGSEFKSVLELEALLGRHPRWSEMKERLEKGSNFPLTDVPDKVRLKDLDAITTRGNHKSAATQEIHLSDAFTKEVKKEWILLFPDNESKHIPELKITSMGAQDQLGVSAIGEFVNNLRITHDLS